MARCQRTSCGHIRRNHIARTGPCCKPPPEHCAAFLSSAETPEPPPTGVTTVSFGGVSEASIVGAFVPSVSSGGEVPPTPIPFIGVGETSIVGAFVPSVGTPGSTKAIVKGIFTRGYQPPAGDPVDMPTLGVNWSDVEPTQGNRQSSVISSKLALAVSRGWPGARLRPFMGYFAPAWAKNLGSGPIPYTNNTTSETGTIPDLWSAAFQSAANAFLIWLAATFDTDPRLRLVFATGGMTRFGEPFYRGAELQVNRTNFLAHGYTIAKDEALMSAQMDWMTDFAQTPVGVCYTPFQTINPNGTKGTTLVPFVGDMMDYQASLFGPSQTVLQSNELNGADIGHISVIEQLQVDRRATYQTQYQTEPRKKLGSFHDTMEWAIDTLQATGVELPENYTSDQTNAQLANWSARLQANGP